MTAVASLRWPGELALRMRRHFALKLLGTTVWTWLFFVAYFHLLRHPSGPVTVIPTTALDRWIPFQPQALIPYVSLWIYVGTAPGLQLRFLQLLVYGLWAGALCATGLAIFYVWPNAVSPTTYDPLGFPGLGVLRGLDAAGNACPSMHVAIALYTAVWLDYLLRQVATPAALRIVNAAWFAAIVYSTLALKQHVVMDVVAGAALGALFTAMSFRWRPR